MTHKNISNFDQLWICTHSPSPARVEFLEAATERADVLGANPVPGERRCRLLALAQDVGDRVERGAHDSSRVLAEAAQVHIGGVLAVFIPAGLHEVRAADG